MTAHPSSWSSTVLLCGLRLRGRVSRAPFRRRIPQLYRILSSVIYINLYLASIALILRYYCISVVYLYTTIYDVDICIVVLIIVCRSVWPSSLHLPWGAGQRSAAGVPRDNLS